MACRALTLFPGLGNTYDNNGNLTIKEEVMTAPQPNRFTWYPYDALNRSQGFYTNDSNTHQVIHVFDGATNGKGKLYYSLTTNYWVGGSTNTARSLNVVTGYDALSRIQGQHQYHRNAADTDWGNVYTTSRTYDLVGNVKSQTYPSGRVVNYSYNTAGQMTTFKGNLGDGTNRVYASEMAYNAAGQMIKEAWGKPVAGYGGMTTTLYQNKHYNNRLQMYDIRLGTSSTDEWTWNRGALRMFYDSNFAYGNGGTNNNGNVYRMDHFVPTNESATTFAMSLDYYGYDALNRITGIWENKQSDTMGETSTGLTQQYVYDRFGNRTVNNAVSNFGVFNLPFNVDQTTNRLLAPNGTISYDAVGNQTNDGYTGAGSRTYDANNKLVSATASGGGTVSYSYNANSSRITKTIGSTTTWYIYGLGGELVAEYPAQGAPSTPQIEYGYRNGELLIEGGCDAVRWRVTDHLGSTRMSVGATGTLASVRRTDYLPFGEEIGAGVGARTTGQGYSQTDCWRQKFTGKERDNETGLDYFGARYYGSTQGRLTSSDPLLSSGRIYGPQTWNRYSYTLNNPLKYIDPSGLYEIDANLNKKDRDKLLDRFEKGRQDLEKARDSYRKKGDNTKADALDKVLKAYGTLNDNNGVTITIGKVKDGAAAEASFGRDGQGRPLLSKEVNGKYVANVVVTFGSMGKVDLENMAHEGSHVEDRQNLISAILKNPLMGDDEAKSLPENLTKYATESKAYHVSSYIEEYNNTPGEFWNKGWQEVDRQKAIDNTLRTSNLYKVTSKPGEQGPRLYETKP